MKDLPGAAVAPEESSGNLEMVGRGQVQPHELEKVIRPGGGVARGWSVAEGDRGGRKT